MGNYIQFGRSHESDFHGITRFGSKICHRSVTCVTCDTRVAVCDTVEPDTGGLPWVFGPTSPRFSIGSSVDLVGLIRSMALSFSPSTTLKSTAKIHLVRSLFLQRLVV